MSVVINNEFYPVISDWFSKKSVDLKEVSEDEDLIEGRIINSMSLMELALLLETITEKRFSVSDLDLEDFRSLSKIFNLLDSL